MKAAQSEWLASPPERACYSADCRCGYTLHKGLHLAVLGEPAVIRRAENHEQIRRQKYSQCRYAGAEGTGNQIADETRGDHDGARRNHRHGHGVEKLAFRQPMKFADYSSIEERHDRQAAAKHEGSGFKKE